LGNSAALAVLGRADSRRRRGRRILALAQMMGHPWQK
jgi:hypothetical protein